MGCVESVQQLHGLVAVRARLMGAQRGQLWLRGWEKTAPEESVVQGAASLVDELETLCGHLQVNVQVDYGTLDA